MSYIRLNKNSKRTADNFDTYPSDVKRRKCERDINTERHLKLPEAANDRLKRLRNSLKNPNSDLTETDFGWKPPALTVNNADIGNKPQLVAKRQCLAAIKADSFSSEEVSIAENRLKYCDRSKAMLQHGIKRNCINDSQQFSMKDRLKIAKLKGPYSSAMNPRIRTTKNATSTSTKSCTANLNNGSHGFESRLNVSAGSRMSAKFSTSTEYVEEPKTCHFQPLYQNACSAGDVFSKSNAIDHCELNESKQSRSTNVSARLQLPKSWDTKSVSNERELINTNLVKTNKIFNATLNKESGFEEHQKQRNKRVPPQVAKALGTPLSLSPTYPQIFNRKSPSKDLGTNLNNVSTNPNITFNCNQSENIFKNASTEAQSSQFPNNCVTSSVNYSTNNMNGNTSIQKSNSEDYFNNNNNSNASNCVFHYSNSERNSQASKYRSPQSLEYQNIVHHSRTLPSTSLTNPPLKKISIQDRLNRPTLATQNIVGTNVNSKYTITSLPNNIFDTTRNNADIETEPMEWANIDIIEVVQNVENMRKNRKFPPEAQSNLQYMLNANNTFAEKYQNPREDNNERDYYIVVDTNVFLSKLGIIKEILNINLKDNKKLYIYLPWMVIQELDYFKDSRCGTKKLQVNARKAIMLLNECLGVKGSHVKAQMVTDALEAKSISRESDDIILACCLQAKERNHIVILLSNDTNLRNKAIINKISAYSTLDILEKLISNMDKSTIQIDVEQIELQTSILLSVVVEESLRNAYGDIIDHMIVKRPPYTLYTALELMRKYWISVFSGLLQKQCLNTIDKLYDLISKKNYTGLPDSEDKSKFVDLTLTLCMFLKTSFFQHVDNINILVNYIQSATGL